MVVKVGGFCFQTADQAKSIARCGEESRIFHRRRIGEARMHAFVVMVVGPISTWSTPLPLTENEVWLK